MSIDAKTLLTTLKYRRILIGELSSLTGYPENTVRVIIQRNLDVFKISGEEVVVVNPVQLALKLVYAGVDLRKISEYLDWRDFEKLSTQILQEYGYDVLHEVKLTTPVRLEIDVFGVESSTGFSIAVDCKHWSTMSSSRLTQAAESHIERLNKFFKYYSHAKSKYKVLGKAKQVAPVIVTLLTPKIRTHRGVLLISISEFPQFLRDRYNVLDHFEVALIDLTRK